MSIFTTIKQQRQQSADDDYTTYIKLLADLDRDDEKQAKQLSDLLDRLGLSPDDAELDYQSCQRIKYLVDATATKKQKSAKAAVVKARQHMDKTTAEAQAAILQWQHKMAESKRDYQAARAKLKAINDAITELHQFDANIKSVLI